MLKCSLWPKIRQLRVGATAFYALCLVGVVQFFSYGKYDYKHIPRDELPSKLYQVTSPKLVVNPSLPACVYDQVLQSNATICDYEIRNFQPTGLVNGSYTPSSCNAQYSVAVLVTYRNRQRQLDHFIPYIHNFMRPQNIHYRIYLIEQQDNKPWNKGLLYNIGARQAMADHFPCLILHDVDLLPIDKSNLYACMLEPRHMSASIDKFRYVLTYDWLVGGVLAIRTDHYKALNGFSNRFLNWGGEDDDFAERIFEHNLNIWRFPRAMSRYSMLQHRPEPRNTERLRVLATDRAARDGLAALDYRDYRVSAHVLYTLIKVWT